MKQSIAFLALALVAGALVIQYSMTGRPETQPAAAPAADNAAAKDDTPPVVEITPDDPPADG